MNLTFDLTKQYWDGWRRFHNDDYYDLVVFDRDEAVLTVTDGCRPEHRRWYPDASISVVSTIDNDCPAMTLPDGAPVKKSWLAGGTTQTLLVDHCTRRVVRITQPARPKFDGIKYEEWQKSMPEWLRSRATVYWPGPGCPPVGAPVQTAQPVVYTPEQKATIRDNVAACKAWWGLIQVNDLETVARLKAMYVKMPWQDANTFRRPMQTTDLLDIFSDIPEIMRMRVAEYGTTTALETIEYPYLLVAPDFKLPERKA